MAEMVGESRRALQSVKSMLIPLEVQVTDFKGWQSWFSPLGGAVVLNTGLYWAELNSEI